LSLVGNEPHINLDLKKERVRAETVACANGPSSSQSLFLAIPFESGDREPLTALLKELP
jgi:hypothetical protein